MRFPQASLPTPHNWQLANASIARASELLGEPLTALGAVQVRLSGKDAACATCHRRSGYGTTEGPFTIRPITGPALRQEEEVAVHSPRIKARLGTRVRPPYTDALIARALRSGVDAAGVPLDRVMPRYALSEPELSALAAYIFTLSAQPSPGVDAEEIHFATVIQPGVEPARRRAMLDVMQAFVKDKTANVRSEEQRRQAGNMRMYRAYRKWVLHIWDLSGPSETWDAQLEAFYKAQPVFALVGGIGDRSWRPVHEFCERMEIPDVFAQVDLPVVSGVNNYNVYFSKGVTLEAEVLAKFLKDQGSVRRVLQVYRRGDAVPTAAAALRAALEASKETSLEDRVLEGTADDAFWRGVAGEKPDALVLWLSEQDVASAKALGSADSPPVYLSFSLLAGKRPDPGLVGAGNWRLVYPSDLPPKHETRLLRDKLWLHNKGIQITDETVQVNALFAMTVLSDAVGHISDSFSRDFFVERVEHVVTQTPMPSIYSQVSLGPGQRFASKGSTVVQLQGAQTQLKALSGWIVP